MHHRRHLGRLPPPPVRLPTRRLSLPFAKAVPTSLAIAHDVSRYFHAYTLGDLAGVEKHFTAWLKFFDDPGFRQYPIRGCHSAFGSASYNAWMLGRADVAREREAQMMAAADRNNPYEWRSQVYAAAATAALPERIRASRGFGSAGARAIREKSISAYRGDVADVFSVSARAQLGRATEGIGLIREGIAGLLEIGARGHQPIDDVAGMARRIAKATSTTRWQRSNRRSRRIPTNSLSGPRLSGYAANCG